MATYEATIWGETYRMRADFAEASSPIQTQDAEGNWISTPYQVADFGHRPQDAMGDLLAEGAREGGMIDNGTMVEIDAAVADMKEVA
jgi:hypothetical protein